MSFATYLPFAAVIHSSMTASKLFKLDKNFGIQHVATAAIPSNYSNFTSEQEENWNFRKYQTALNIAKRALKKEKIAINLDMVISVGINNNKKFNIIIKDYQNKIAYYITNSKFEKCNIEDDFLNAKLYFNN